MPTKIFMPTKNFIFVSQLFVVASSDHEGHQTRRVGGKNPPVFKLASTQGGWPSSSTCGPSPPLFFSSYYFFLSPSQATALLLCRSSKLTWQQRGIPLTLRAPQEKSWRRSSPQNRLQTKKESHHHQSKLKPRARKRNRTQSLLKQILRLYLHLKLRLQTHHHHHQQQQQQQPALHPQKPMSTKSLRR